MWVFEPHVAESVFDQYVSEHRIKVHRDQWLNRANGVHRKGTRISAITTLSGRKYSGRMFIDATYEGDLMAAAGVSYHVGREAQSVYGETWNGIQVDKPRRLNNFSIGKMAISAYRIPSNPSSGILPRISLEPPGLHGEGDRRLQAFCFRMCLTNRPENRLTLHKPRGYDASQYELLIRILNTGWREILRNSSPIPNNKTDTNTAGPFSFDNIGYNWDYAEASYERRRQILSEHRTYQEGMLYFLATDPRVPREVRAEIADWGLATRSPISRNKPRTSAWISRA
jgi:hypothetical protein